jgi:WD40 repeat protein
MRTAALFLLAVAAAAQNRSIPAGADVRTLSFSKDGSVLYGICADNKLRQWDARSGALRNTVAWNAGERAAGLHTGSGLVALAGKGAVAVADLTTGAPLRKIPVGDFRVNQFAIAPDGQSLAGSSRVAGNSRDEIMRLWDASGKERFAVAGGIGGASASAISPDGTVLVAGSWDTNLRVWNTRNGELVKLIEDLPVAMFAIAFTPDGKSLATAGVDRTVYVWDAKTWKLDRKFSGQQEMISAIAFSGDGKSLATGGFNDITSKHPVSILVWDFATGKVSKTLPAPHRVGSVALSPDGKMLAAVAGEPTVHVWELR